MPVYHIPLTPGLKLGLESPSAVVPLHVATLRGGRHEIPFLLDTGAAVSLMPIPVALALGIDFDPDAGVGDDPPRTIHGALDGCVGEIDVLLGTTAYLLPCVFYHPPAPPPTGYGPPGRRRAVPPASDLDDWEVRSAAATGPGGAAAAPRLRLRGVLGRLGFLNKTDVLFQRTRVVIATGSDRVAPPSKPRPVTLAPSAPRRLP